MTEVLNIGFWLAKQIKYKNQQFELVDGDELLGSTKRVRRIIDGKIFHVDQQIIVRGYGPAFIWYFHPDMKTVEILDYERVGKGIMIEINYIESDE